MKYFLPIVTAVVVSFILSFALPIWAAVLMGAAIGIGIDAAIYNPDEE